MRFASKSDYVLGRLKERILSGIYKQGESIVISKIASEFGVSSIPVREAIKRLESEGLVQILPHKGAKVSTFDQNQINEIIHARAVLEGYAAATAIDHMDEEDILNLKCFLEAMRQYATEMNDEQYARLNTEFHRYIYERCPYQKFNQLIFNLWDGGNFTKSVFAYFPKDMVQSYKEHCQIVDAIESKDSTRVESLMRKHKLKNISLLGKIK